MGDNNPWRYEHDNEVRGTVARDTSPLDVKFSHGPAPVQSLPVPPNVPADAEDGARVEAYAR